MTRFLIMKSLHDDTRFEKCVLRINNEENSVLKCCEFLRRMDSFVIFFSYDINIPIMVLILYCLAVILFFPKEKCS